MMYEISNLSVLKDGRLLLILWGASLVEFMGIIWFKGV